MLSFTCPPNISFFLFHFPGTKDCIFGRHQSSVDSILASGSMTLEFIFFRKMLDISWLFDSSALLIVSADSAKSLIVLARGKVASWRCKKVSLFPSFMNVRQLLLRYETVDDFLISVRLKSQIAFVAQLTDASFFLLILICYYLKIKKFIANRKLNIEALVFGYIYGKVLIQHVPK